MGRQTQIAGTEREYHPEIDKAAAKYAKVRDERMDLTDSEVKAKEELLQKMLTHKCEKYIGEDFVVTLDVETSIKVRKVKESDLVEAQEESE